MFHGRFAFGASSVLQQTVSGGLKVARDAVLTVALIASFFGAPFVTTPSGLRLGSLGLSHIAPGVIGPGVAGADEPAKPAARKLDFETDVAPILKARCVKCHAGAEPSGGLTLTSRRELLRGGKSGPALRIAAAESSLIWEKLASNEMPKGGPPLTAMEKGVIRAWINDSSAAESAGDDVSNEAGGATNAARSDHWSFRPPVRPGVPRVRDATRVRNPIDAFVLAKLETQRATLNDEAIVGALARRASFDLLGLPPDFEDSDASHSVRDAAVPAPSAADATASSAADSNAYERMIERLLASPHYGERWGRHWLDVAGYADSAGVLAEDRPLQTAFRYRDYVIRAFNSDKPYDRFLQEQLAGDELTDYWGAYERSERLPDEVVEAVTATGFLRCAADASRPDFNTIKNADAQYFYPTLNDTLQIVSSATLGLTLQCARCHSHKYDPIPQTEYYRLQAVFMSALRPKQWIPQMERTLPVASAAQRKSADEHNKKLDEQIGALKKELTDLRSRFQRQLFDQRLVAVSAPIRADVQAAFAKPAADRSPVERYLFEKFQPDLQPDEKTLDKLLPETFPEFRTAVEQRSAEIAAAERRRIGFDEIRALYDLPGPVVTPVLRRGDPLTPGPAVEPGVPAMLATPVSFQWTPPPADSKTSGRRLAFARWLTQPGHPLTARVIVNRLWLHHFGEALVATPEDFGTLGASPSHPELLDWLACELVDSGWSLKHVQRLILLSSTYRQRVAGEDRAPWRQRLRRLEAEPLRDAMLAAADMLDRRFYGYPSPVARRPDGEVTIADGQNDRRRSIYVQVLRGNPLTILQTHDQPVMETNCTRRGRSTVSTQALTILNSDVVVGYAQAFAERLLRLSPAQPLERLHAIAYARQAAPDELDELRQFFAKQTALYESLGDKSDAARRRALADVCHLVLASNEFVYID